MLMRSRVPMIVLALACALGLSSCAAPPATATPETVTPIPLTTTLGSPAGTLGQTWNKITVGQSTSEDTIAVLGLPNDTQELPNGYAFLYYDDEIDRRSRIANPEIWFDTGDIVAQIRVILQPPSYTGMHLSDFIDQFGVPDYVTWRARRSLINPSVYWNYPGGPTSTPEPETLPPGDPLYRAVVFVNAGVLLEVWGLGVPENSEVVAVTYYQPCSLECVKVKFHDTVFGSKPPYNPANIREPRDNAPEDPWGFSKAP